MLRVKITIGCDVDAVQCNEHFDSKWSTQHAPADNIYEFYAQPDVKKTVLDAISAGWHASWDAQEQRVRWYCPYHDEHAAGIIDAQLADHGMNMDLGHDVTLRGI